MLYLTLFLKLKVDISHLFFFVFSKLYVFFVPDFMRI